MYDNTNKLLISQFCADYTSWLLGTSVELAEMEPTELYYEPVRADGVVLLKNADIICHWEFQTDPDLAMAYRMIDYYVRLKAKYPNHRIVQIVVYLRETTSERVFTNFYQDGSTYHEFEVVRLWEQDPEMLMRYTGLLPLAVLSKTHDRVGVLRRVAELIEMVPDGRERGNLMAGAAILAGLRLEKEVINQILRKDVMKGSVIYDQIFQEGEARGEARGEAQGEVRGKRDLLIKQLTRRVGVLSVEMVGRVEGLSLERVEDLGVALLDFSSVDDLVGWLG
jgi:predicted transposase/invertase (TIGR01784 family)